MNLFRKKPVVVAAEQYEEGRTLSSQFTAGAQGVFNYTEKGTLLIRTLEGTMEAQPGDWIIRGIADEFYPCKPNIFEETYELAEVINE